MEGAERRGEMPEGPEAVFASRLPSVTRTSASRDVAKQAPAAVSSLESAALSNVSAFRDRVPKSPRLVSSLVSAEPTKASYAFLRKSLALLEALVSERLHSERKVGHTRFLRGSESA